MMIVIADADKTQQAGFFGPASSSSSPPAYSDEPSYHINASSPRHNRPATPIPPTHSYPASPAEHHQHQHQHHHHHHHHHGHRDPGEHHHLAAPVVYRRSPARRFCQALAFALIIYLATVSLTANYLVRMAYRDDYVGVPRAADGAVITSIGSSNWTSHSTHPSWAPTFAHTAETSFTLPVSNNKLYLVSHGSYQSGNVRVIQSNKVGHDARVDVRVAYHNLRALARATVCSLRKSGNARGIGIYTPNPTLWWNDPRDQLKFEVVWTLPAPSSFDDPLRVRAFTTDVSNFGLDFGHLWQGVKFGDLQLSTSNAPIDVESITLTRGSVTSSNGAITGHFNASDVLKLRTSNASINATASLLSTKPGKGPTQLEMRTGNGCITSSVSLMTPTSGQISGSDWTGDFAVRAHTSNGAVQLEYDDMPLGAHLTSDIRTSNDRVLARMHPAFEGHYTVSTSNSRAVIKEDTTVIDPSGYGRRRVVTQTHSRPGTEATGEVYWSGDIGRGRRNGARDAGVSTVQTSNGRAELKL